MSTATDSIIVKIKKLLALAQNNTNEAEAELAMGRVQELLAQYNLDMAKVESTRMSGQSTTAEDKRTQENHKRGAMYKYQQELWSTIAHVNFCWHWTTPVYKGSRIVTRHHYFVGKEANVIAVKLLGDYLEETINRLCPWKGKDCLSKSAISWKEGCAARLRTRLYYQQWEREAKSQAQKQEAASHGETAIALRDVAVSEYERNYDFLYGEGAYRAAQERMALREQTTQEVAKVETEEERKKREAKEERWRKQQQAKRDKFWASKDLTAYLQGERAAEKISLDAQVGASPEKVRIAK